MTRLLRAQDYRRMPWKNGAGETAEIAVAPDGAGLDTFDWRISMAPVLEDGPFSRFDGVDRTLTIVDGAGMRLSIGEAPPVDVTRQSAPLAFAADIATTARLIDGPILDLNVMTRRDRMTHRVTRLVIAQPTRLAITAPAALVCIDGAAHVATARGEIGLQRLDTLLADNEGEAITITGRPNATFLRIEMQAR